MSTRLRVYVLQLVMSSQIGGIGFVGQAEVMPRVTVSDRASRCRNWGWRPVQ